MSITILTVINVFSAAILIILVLMQQSKGDMGSAFGGGGSQSMFGSRGSANFLSRSTAIMCTVFFITSLALAYLYNQRTTVDSVIQQGSEQQSIEKKSDIPAIPGTQQNIEKESDLPTIPSAQQNDTELPVIPE